MSISAADVWKIYVKPSLDGRIVFRKRTARHKSARLRAAKDRVAEYSKAGSPSKRCHDELVSAGKCPVKRVYVPGKGYRNKRVCPIKLMIPCLRRKMKEAHGGAAVAALPEVSE